MFNEINIRFSCDLDNKPNEGNMKLNLDDNLENAFDKHKIIKSPKNKQKESVFYLKRENENKVLLDKKVQIKELNLKEGDLILVSFKDIINVTENMNTHSSHNNSSANLNGEITSSSNIERPIKKKE